MFRLGAVVLKNVSSYMWEDSVKKAEFDPEILKRAFYNLLSKWYELFFNILPS